MPEEREGGGERVVTDECEWCNTGSRRGGEEEKESGRKEEKREEEVERKERAHRREIRLATCVSEGSSSKENRTLLCIVWAAK